MNQFEFTAFIVGVPEDQDSLVAGLSADKNCSSYLNFQRDPDFVGDDDRGVYVEFNDQTNSGYNCICRCPVAADSLTVEFTEPIDRQKRVMSAIVHYGMATDDLFPFIAMLRRTFTGCESLLEVDVPS
jgi:hypothetical protein